PTECEQGRSPNPHMRIAQGESGENARRRKWTYRNAWSFSSPAGVITERYVCCVMGDLVEVSGQEAQRVGQTGGRHRQNRLPVVEGWAVGRLATASGHHQWARSASRSEGCGPLRTGLLRRPARRRDAAGAPPP